MAGLVIVPVANCPSKHPPSPIHLVPQNRRPPKHHHPSGVQRQVLPGGRVPASPWRFRSYGKLPEPAKEDIFPGFQGSLDQLENVVDQTLRLVFGESDLIIEGLDQIFFREGHSGLLGGFLGLAGNISLSLGKARGVFRGGSVWSFQNGSQFQILP
jgi:hypothetical protein